MHFDKGAFSCTWSLLKDAQCPLCCHHSPGADGAGSVDGDWLAPPALGGGGILLAPPTGDGAWSISRLLASPSWKYSSMARSALRPCTALALLPALCVDGDAVRPADGGDGMFSWFAGTGKSAAGRGDCKDPEGAIDEARTKADRDASPLTPKVAASNSVSPGA